MSALASPQTHVASPTRKDLAACFVEFATSPLADGRIGVRGTLLPAASLKGPPNRLHGGLHAAVRLILPYARVAGGEAAEAVRVSLRMRRSIPLLEQATLDGTYDPETGTLDTRVDGSDRLAGTLRAGPPADTSEVMARFSRLLAEDRADGPPDRVQGQGDLAVDTSRQLVTLPLDAESLLAQRVVLHRFLDKGLVADPVFTAVVLDVLGAYALGMNLDCRLFTTHLELALLGSASLFDGPLLALGSRHAAPVVGSTLDPVTLDDGRVIGEQRVEVLLTRADFSSAIGHGFVSLVPVRPPPLS